MTFTDFNNRDWLKITTGTTDGQNYVEFSASTNTSSARNTIVVTKVGDVACTADDKKFKITQSGTTCDCNSIELDTYEVSWGANEGSTSKASVNIEGSGYCHSDFELSGKSDSHFTYEIDDDMILINPKGTNLKTTPITEDLKVKFKANGTDCTDNVKTITLTQSACNVANIYLSPTYLEWAATESGSGSSKQINAVIPNEYRYAIGGNSTVYCTSPHFSATSNASSVGFAVHVYPTSNNPSQDTPISGTVVLSFSSCTDTPWSLSGDVVHQKADITCTCGDGVFKLKNLNNDTVVVPSTGGDAVFEYEIVNGACLTDNNIEPRDKTTNYYFSGISKDVNNHTITISGCAANTSSTVITDTGYIDYRMSDPSSTACNKGYTVVQAPIKCYSINVPLVVSSLSGEVTVSTSDISCDTSICETSIPISSSTLNGELCAGNVTFLGLTDIRSTDGSFKGHGYVDLGLPSGTLWATEYIGQLNEFDVDNIQYFAYGETSGYTISQIGSGEGKRCFSTKAYKFSPNCTSEHDECQFNKYNSTDGLTELVKEDDAAYANWGGDSNRIWRVPSSGQIQELVSNTEDLFIENYKGSGENVHILCSKLNGKKIIFTVHYAGLEGSSGTEKDCNNKVKNTYTSTSHSRTSRLNDISALGETAYLLTCEKINGAPITHVTGTYRHIGRPIRPVIEPNTNN